MKRAWLATGVLMAMAALAACGGSDAAEPTASSATSSPTTAVETSAVATSAAPTTSAAPATTVPATTTPATTTPPTTTTTVPATVPVTTVPPEPERPPTVDELLASPTVLNIAHAGGDQDYPHSTMYAYSEAVAAGATVLEMDIRVTADGHVVIIHDADTAKTSDQTLVVADSTLADLQAIDNAYWFSPQCWPCHDLADDAYPFRGVRTGTIAPPEGYTPDDFRILSLAELDAAFPSLPFDIEIKPEGDAGLAAGVALAAELERLDRVDSTVVVSFDSAIVDAFHTVAPDIATSPGVDEMAAWILSGQPLHDFHQVVQVPPEYEGVVVLSPQMLQLATDSVAVWVWPNDAATQENEGFYRELVAMGIDGILAGRPAQAATAIAG